MTSAEKPRPAKKRIWRARSTAAPASSPPNLRAHTARARASSLAFRSAAVAASSKRRADPVPGGCAGCRSERHAHSRATRRIGCHSGSAWPPTSRAEHRLQPPRSAVVAPLRPYHPHPRTARWRAKRSSLRRNSTRLCSRCASHCSARPFRDSGGAAMVSGPRERVSSPRRQAAAGYPSLRAPCSRFRQRCRGSRAGTRARCPCPGRSFRRCRRTRRRSSRGCGR